MKTNLKTGTKPVVLSGQDLYDTLMSQIEPELTTKGIKKLSEKYPNETPGQLVHRKERYAKAWESFNHALSKYSLDLQGQVQKYIKTELKRAEKISRNKEVETIRKLESDISLAA